MVIKKNAMNQPNIHHYLSKLETNTSMSLDSSLTTTDAMRVEISNTIMKTAPKVLFTIPVAVVDDARIPPVTLTVNYESETHVDINMTATDKVNAAHKYNIKGAYEIVQEYSAGQGMTGYVAAENWEIQTQHAETITNKDLYLTTAVYQKMNVTTTIGWLARDMEINFSPPVEFRISPILTSVSVTEDVKRCTVDVLNIEGNFNVSDARLIVDAFDVPIWNTLLAEGFNRTVNITEDEMFRSCSADCFPDEKDNLIGDAHDIVGQMKNKILRNNTSFYKLHQMVGSDVLFASEEADTAVWCGYPGRSCARCTTKPAGYNDVDKCADRMMTSSLASKTSLLGKYVTSEWPNRKLIVHEAWDEPTSVHPHGEHGNNSLHYEGRAAIVSVSKNINKTTPLIDQDPNLTERLHELAVCSGFPYVSNEDDRKLVHVAVKDEEVTHTKRRKPEPVNSKDQLAFENALKKIETMMSADRCPDITVNPTDHWPPQYTNEVDACGQTSYKISRENEDAMKTLYEYSDVDVQFVQEGKEGHSCGLGRGCISCEKPSMSKSTWDWCATRVMSPRMALRLKRLAALVKTDSVLKGGQIQVLKAFSDQRKDLYNDGRAIQLTYIKNGTQGDADQMKKLAALSVCAGFDFVKFLFTHIEAFVKEQSGYRTTLNQFPSGTVMISVDLPLENSNEFSYPESLQHESKKPALIRSLSDSTRLSKHFKIGDFKDISTSYLRIDSTLVECLDMVKESFKQGIDVLKAYTTKSTNMEMNSEWTQEQLDRFQMGQAVVIQHEEQTTESTTELTKLLMSTCTPTLRLQRRGLSLSIREDGICSKQPKLRGGKYCVYVGLYPLERTEEKQYVKISTSLKLMKTVNELWSKVWENIKEYRSKLTSGGPQIIPYNAEDVCKPSELGKGNEFLSFQLHHFGFCLNFKQKERCERSMDARQAEALKLWTQMSSTASKNTLPTTEMKRAIFGCLVDVCGGCSGSGRKWDKKVKACVDVVSKYISYTRKPLVKKTDKVSVFNTENIQSAAHGLACNGGVKCVENVQLYSMFQSTINSKYKPEPNNSIEEALFDGHDNPSPLLEIVEQFVAKQAAGNVSVYIESIRDISALRNILKVLMIYNRDIEMVTFLTFTGVKKDKLATAIQRKIETWAGSACPIWSRFAVVPYKIEDVHPARVARSIEDGRHRNKMKEKQRNWEIDWIMMT
ncbi:uncharacterized protein [Mytilus edulis]